MKTIYWQPRKVSQQALVLICGVALLGVSTTELCKRNVFGVPETSEKFIASQLAAQSMQTIREERLRRNHVFDPAFDPTLSGMIGDVDTPTTSVTGHLEAKQTSANPNFAAAILDMLQQAGVQKGDVVAVGCSGSFPALNLCLYCALETLEAKPIIVSSAGASQFGANMPDLLWIDMERLLYEEGLISFRSVAASLGGYEDQAAGMSEEGRRLLHEGIARNNLPLLYDDEFGAAIESRMKIYHDHAEGRPIKAYINVGGGAVSCGTTAGKNLYEPGLNLEFMPEALTIDSVMTRFASQDTPLIHLSHIVKIAETYQLPAPPEEMPLPGEGWVFYDTWMHRWLAGVFLLILGIIFARVARKTLWEKPALLTLAVDDQTANHQAA